MINLSKEDWAEIYYALAAKRYSTTVEGDHEWEGHLENIMEQIGEDGEDAAEFGVSPVEGRN